MENTTQNNYAVPVAIVVAGALIALALYFVSTKAPAGPITLPQPTGSAESARQDVAGVQPDDHIIGNPDAELVIVEFSDTECPFCNRFHSTMNEVMDEFGDSGKVAWVYRNFPLTSLHAKAVPESIALECAAELGGNDKFWEYTNMLYANTPGNDGLEAAKLIEFATAVGLDEAEFAKCRERSDIAQRVQDDFDEARASGGQGTPYSLVLYKNQQIEIPGALPFTDYQSGGQTQPGMKSIIEGILAQ